MVLTNKSFTETFSALTVVCANGEVSSMHKGTAMTIIINLGPWPYSKSCYVMHCVSTVCLGKLYHTYCFNYHFLGAHMILKSPVILGILTGLAKTFRWYTDGTFTPLTSHLH